MGNGNLRILRKESPGVKDAGIQCGIKKLFRLNFARANVVSSMKIVVAPNAFKGSLSGSEAAAAIAGAAGRIWPHAEILQVPVSDGGDGLLDVVSASRAVERVPIVVKGPLGRPVESEYLFDKSRMEAVVEMSLASGLALLASHEYDPASASTFGTGELAVDAFRRGAESLVLGIGGSATCDGGTGIAAALGVVFRDAEGREISPCGARLIDIASIDTGKVIPELADAGISIICDVDNPLLGSRGAARVYAPQKGAGAGEVELLEEGLANFASVLEKTFGVDVRNLRGAGAAGGISAGLHAIFGARLCPGAATVLDLLDLENKVRDAGLVLTGEGRVDSQTIEGKAPAGVAEIAKKFSVPCICFAGKAGENLSGLYETGFTSIFSICPEVPEHEAMENAGKCLEKLAFEKLSSLDHLW